MPSQRAPVIAFALLCLALAGAVAWYLPMLPDRVATHFDAAGQPNGWSSPAGLIESAVLTIAATAVVFFAGELLRWLPDGLINLHNKNYWLAPERRDASLGFVRGWLRWFAVVTLALLTLMIGAALRANLATQPRLPPYLLWALLPYGALVLAMTVLMVRRFRAPPA